ncbi:MAG TPA: hypothetical protein PLN35_02710 [Quisquiliibacterium sp.]|nr:hypothetical protein [Quisquiliibacterium sp.]
MEHDAHLILHKTDKALQELRHRTYGLNPRVRQILILIDGRRSCRELARMMPGQELAQCVQMLQEQGFVQRVRGDGPADPGTAPPRPTPPDTGSAPPRQAPADPRTSPPRPTPAAPGTIAELHTLQRRVVRLLLDAIGPHGDELAIRVERSRSLDELRALLPAAASVVEAVSGRPASLRFLERVASIRDTP